MTLRKVIRKEIFYFSLVVIAGFLCCRIVALTPFNAHPDEVSHVAAFEYYETNWWPPDLGSDELLYSKYGQSHVYTGELIYLIYGKIGYIVTQLLQMDDHHYLVYRLLNVLLFFLTLSTLFFIRCDRVKTIPIALAFLCIPQVSYIYSYANYDGWAISLTVFLFVWSLIMTERMTTPWSWPATCVLGFLTGLVFASRQPDILGCVVPYFLLGEQIFRDSSRRQLLKFIIGRLIVVALIAFFIASPLKLFFPLSQGNYDYSYQQMREEKAHKPFKPSVQSAPYYHLAEKGETYAHLLTERKWLALTSKSFYGVYGYMSLFSPPWVYYLAGIIAFTSLLVAIATSIIHWSSITFVSRSLVCLSPLLFLINIGASIYYSMYIDFQPQGRYLFCTLIPFCLFLTGAVYCEHRLTNGVRFGFFVISYGLAVWNLFTIAPLAQPS